MVGPETETEGEAETDEVENEHEEQTNNGTSDIWVELFKRELPNRNLLYETETADDVVEAPTTGSGRLRGRTHRRSNGGTQEELSGTSSFSRATTRRH